MTLSITQVWIWILRGGRRETRSGRKARGVQRRLKRSQLLVQRQGCELEVGRGGWSMRKRGRGQAVFGVKTSYAELIGLGRGQSSDGGGCSRRGDIVVSSGVVRIFFIVVVLVALALPDLAMQARAQALRAHPPPAWVSEGRYVRHGGRWLGFCVGWLGEV